MIPRLRPGQVRVGRLARRLVVVALVLASVGAAFTGADDPSWTAASAQLLSTNPNLTITGGGSTHTVVSVADAAPGDGGEGYVTLTNEGLETGNLSVSVPEVAGDENGTLAVEAPHDDTPDESEMPGTARFGLWLDVDQDGVWDDGDRGLSAHDDLVYVPPSDIDMEPAESYENGSWENVTELMADESVDFRLRWDVPADAGNEIMTDEVNATIRFNLSQDS